MFNSIHRCSKRRLTLSASEPIEKWKLLLATGLCVVSTSQLAHAEALLGSTFQLEASNSPGSFNDTLSLTPGTTLLDGGALSLTISILPGGGRSEWFVFDFNTTAGGPISAPGDYWYLGEVLDAIQPLFFNQGYIQFNDNGVALPPTSSIFGGYGVISNPVPGEIGSGLGTPLKANPNPEGPLNLYSYITPFDYLGVTGVNYADVNGVEQAWKLSPQTVPELSTWAMMALGFAGLGLVGYRASARNGEGRRTPSAA